MCSGDYRPQGIDDGPFDDHVLGVASHGVRIHTKDLGFYSLGSKVISDGNQLLKYHVTLAECSKKLTKLPIYGLMTEVGNYSWSKALL